ncbi:hypothetical protein HDV05_004030 [Chytridiales sp. JEL 0842]|nr:hypothetical protein HDV05_004030 [Chytridiales sp. JEL 0842]
MHSIFVKTSLLIVVTSIPVLAQHSHSHEGHDHGAENGAITIDHKLNPAASDFKPSNFANDLFDEYSTGSGARRAVTLNDLVKVYQDMRILPSGSAADEDAHAGHDHLQRRELNKFAKEERRSLLVARQDSLGDGCLLPFDLMTIYGFNTTQGLNRTEFERISPGLVYVSSAKLCASKEFQFNSSPETSTPKTNGPPSTISVWMYSLLAVTLVTLSCMLGLFFVPLMKRSKVVTDVMLSFMIALGAGTLVSDAVLHLLPSILGLHSHDHSEHEAHDHSHDLSYIWKLNVVLLGLYIFWTAEQGLQYLHGRHVLSTTPTKSHAHINDLGHEASIPHLHAPRSILPSSSSSSSSSTVDEAQSDASKPRAQPSLWENFKTVKSVALLILIGDAMHNLVDGIAIGASFAFSIRMGLTTSIAVLLHELPHELSDYAILYSSGFSAWRAAYLNMLSNLTAYVGMSAGILLTTKTGFVDTVRESVFALAGGMFIYIAVADLLPTLKEVHSIDSDKDEVFGGESSKGVVAVETNVEMAKKDGERVEVDIHPFSWKRVLAQHLGLLLGWVIMLLIGLFEDKIKV